MKNEEKAQEIASTYSIFDGLTENKQHFIGALMEMAKWKDEQAKRQFIDKAWQWIFRVFVITAPLDFQQAIEKEFRKEMKGE